MDERLFRYPDDYEMNKDCAREHFKAISGENVVYDVVNNFSTLLAKVMK